MALDRDEVIDAAVRILDEYGMADLSMRRLADSLGVKAGALYWHVANKQSLLAAVADRILREVPDVEVSDVEIPEVESTPSEAEALAGWAVGLRQVLLRHRDSADLVATGLASGLCEGDPLAGVRALLEPVVGADAARRGSRALLHLVLGHVAEEQNLQIFAQLGSGAAVDPVEQGLAFEHGIGALISGLLR
ncbi:TetR family transcriptional regulator [Luteococcus sp. OSA5]|uniref:TetR family transcriptional regulator n=1 Tax=Luteococcus sp. OSA5 TaxID=3401630 RepID=UPI003B427FC1